MSDATLPTLSPPSTNTNTQSVPSSDPIPSEGEVFPFLVNSQHSVTNGEPPEVDNGKLARQKRKRTSAEDQAILETEYNRNPKPDKTARIEIVKRVSLDEKEVQIWFQNRRQNTRRKSRPLLPHEIASFGVGGMVPLPSDARVRNSWMRSGEVPQPSSTPPDTATYDRKDEQRLDGKLGMSEPTSHPIKLDPDESARRSLDMNTSKVANVKLLKGLPSSRTAPVGQVFTNFKSHFPSQPLQNTLGYLSNRRNTPSTPMSSQENKVKDVKLSSSTCSEVNSMEDVSLQPPSQVRLSMSLDGKAELIASQLSPQRPVSTGFDMNDRRSGLKRSHSAIPIGHVRHNAISGLPQVPRIPTGRSRDARTWEFCCDTDARDELTTQAENESSGSAVAAISLLRSTSMTLKSNMNKRTATGPKGNSKSHGKRARLGRATSSLARLQDVVKRPLGSPSGDSDKENWLPLNDSGDLQRRDLTAARPSTRRRQQALSETAPRRAETGDRSRLKVPARSTLDNHEISDNHRGTNDASRDVEKFMRGEVSPSKKGDLDCIEGLLSLSQGIWR